MGTLNQTFTELLIHMLNDGFGGSCIKLVAAKQNVVVKCIQQGRPMQRNPQEQQVNVRANKLVHDLAISSAKTDKKEKKRKKKKKKKAHLPFIHGFVGSVH